MFWVFCNSCFIKPGHGCKRKFYITSCSHIFCEQCINAESSYCNRCQDTCINVLCNSEVTESVSCRPDQNYKIKLQMPDEVKEVFSQGSEYPFTLFKAIEFQEFHRARALSYTTNLNERYLSAKNIVKDIRDKFQILEQKYQSLKLLVKSKEEAIVVLKEQLRAYTERTEQRASMKTPATPGHNQTPFQPSFFKTGCFQGQGPTPSYDKFRNMPKTPMYTPDSGMSRPSIPSTGPSPLSIGGRRPPGYTPPSNTLALLSLLNRSKKSN